MRDLFEMDKNEYDPKQRWYATESTLMELNILEDEEIKQMADERLRVVIDDLNRQKEELLRTKEEHQRAKEELRTQAK